MRRGLIGLVALVVMSVPALARDDKHETKAEYIKIDSGGEEIKGYLAVPQGKGPFPGIILIQEWWGLNPWMEEQTKKLAAQGYVCLAPDLYRGKVATEMATARKLMMGLPADRAARDLKAALDTLAARKDVNKEKLGSIGWCMGGALSLQTALADKRIGACVMCYGRVITDQAKLKPLNARVLGIFGKEDKGIPIAEVRKFKTALESAGKTVEAMHEYEAGHGFMRENNGPNKNPEYREEPAKAAWKEIHGFFAKTLKGT